MNREFNFQKIYNAVSGTELAANIPDINENGREKSVDGIEWRDLFHFKVAPEVTQQIAIITLKTVLKLAIVHGILIKDRNMGNVIIAPIMKDADEICFRRTTGEMRVVQVDFGLVEYDFDNYWLSKVMLDCVQNLSSSNNEHRPFIEDLSQQIKTIGKTGATGKIENHLKNYLSYYEKTTLAEFRTTKAVLSRLDDFWG